MLRFAVPSLPTVMLCVAGLWLVMAAFGTWIPSFVTDRVPKQIIPVTTWLFQFFGADTPPPESAERLAPTIKRVAHLFQFIIGLTELIAGVAALAAAAMPRQRVTLTNFSMGLATGLFGAFMLTMFAIHSKDLPAWNQYPAILAWFGVTWALVMAFPKSQSPQPAA
ncbi:MAG: hypothetical protein ACK51T_13980 [bacterium]